MRNLSEGILLSVFLAFIAFFSDCQTCSVSQNTSKMRFRTPPHSRPHPTRRPRRLDSRTFGARPPCLLSFHYLPPPLHSRLDAVVCAGLSVTSASLSVCLSVCPYSRRKTDCALSTKVSKDSP